MKRSFSGGVWRNWNAIEAEAGQLLGNEWLLVSETHRQASASHTSLQLSHISQSRLQLGQTNEKGFQMWQKVRSCGLQQTKGV